MLGLAIWSSPNALICRLHQSDLVLHDEIACNDSFVANALGLQIISQDVQGNLSISNSEQESVRSYLQDNLLFDNLKLLSQQVSLA